MSHQRRPAPGSFIQPLTALLVAFLLVTSAAAQEPSVPRQYQAAVGEPHPDFVLPRIDNGQPLRLSDYRGQKVLLIHFASW